VLYYQDERAQLEKQAIEAIPSVDLSIAYTPVIAFPLTIAGVGVERLLEPVRVTQTQGGLYLVEEFSHNVLPFGNPISGELLAPMRARFLVLKGWYDRYIDLLPHSVRDRVIAQFFDGTYFYLGPTIQYKKRGKVPPSDEVARWERDKARRADLGSTTSAQRVITVRYVPPTWASMNEQVLLCDPEHLQTTMRDMRSAVIVDVRPTYPNERELRATYGGSYFRQGSWWKPVNGGLADPVRGMRQILPLLVARKNVLLYCTCPAERNQGEHPCHRVQVRDYVQADLARREAEEEKACKSFWESTRDGGALIPILQGNESEA